jgi:hypothetical protein
MVEMSNIAQEPKIDTDRIDDAVLALLRLGLRPLQTLRP